MLRNAQQSQHPVKRGIQKRDETAKTVRQAVIQPLCSDVSFELTSRIAATRTSDGNIPKPDIEVIDCRHGSTKATIVASRRYPMEDALVSPRCLTLSSHSDMAAKAINPQL